MNRRLAARVLLLAAVCLCSGCTAGAGTLLLTVYPDATGTVELYRITPPQNEWQRVKGSELIHAYRISAYKGRYKNLNDLKIGDITFTFSEKPDRTGYQATCSLPTTADAEWFKMLGVTKTQIEKLLKMNPPEKARDEDLSAFAINFSMPGVIQENELAGRDLPKGWRLESTSTWDHQPKDIAVLLIPMADLIDGKIKSVKWEITCGPLLEPNENAWKSFKEEAKKKE